MANVLTPAPETKTGTTCADPTGPAVEVIATSAGVNDASPRRIQAVTRGRSSGSSSPSASSPDSLEPASASDPEPKKRRRNPTCAGYRDIKVKGIQEERQLFALAG